MQRATKLMVWVATSVVAATTVACGGGGAGGNAGAGTPGLVTLVTPAVPAGTTGIAYATQFEATFPHDPGTFHIASGQLPPGLTLDTSTGDLSGYPRQVGAFRFEIAARDGTDVTLPPGRDATFAEARRSFALDVARGAPHILPQSMPSAQYRASYAYPIDVAGGTAPYTFTLLGGTLPAGLSVGTDGTIGSFPSQAQPDPYEFDVMVTDANGLTDTASLAVTVVVKPLLILTSNPIPQAAKDFAYVLPISLASTGGGAPFSWTQAPVGAGETNLAAIGMQVTPDGRLTDLGTGPTTLGTHKFTLQVTDEATQVATRQFQLTVNPGPVLTDINPRLASLPSLYTVTGLNFQPGAKLVLKPGASEAIFTPTFVSPTTLTFSAPFPTPIGATGPVAVKVLNPDGGFHTKPSALVFPANTLGFATKGFIGSTLSSTGLDAADVNGDGFADIIHSGSGAITAVYNTTTSTTGGLILHMNLGTTSPTFSTLVIDSGNYTDVKFVDVNVDGKLDIVALGHTTIRSWIGLGNGTFTAGPTSTLNGPGSPLWPSEMTFGRFNADAIPDVAFGTPNFNYLGYQNINGRVYSMAGTGTGAFTPLDAATTTISGTYGVVSLQAIDTDNDGHSELAAGCGLSVSAGPAFNFTTLSASGFFSGWTSRGGALNPPLYSSTTGTAVGDFLGNGTKQLAAVTSGSPNYSNYQVFRIYSGNDLSAITTLPVPNAAGKSLAAIDGDFDTKSDILMTSSQSTILVYRGSTQTIAVTLDAASGTPALSSPKTGRVVAADINGDGMADILATTSYWHVNGMASNHGTTYTMSNTGNGGSMGIVFYLNTSN